LLRKLMRNIGLSQHMLEDREENEKSKSCKEARIATARESEVEV